MLTKNPICIITIQINMYYTNLHMPNRIKIFIYNFELLKHLWLGKTEIETENVSLGLLYGMILHGMGLPTSC